MPAIFISHSNLDQKISDDAKTFYLFQHGFERVFLDFEKVSGIGAGANWEKQLYEELARGHAVLLLCAEKFDPFFNPGLGQDS